MRRPGSKAIETENEEARLEDKEARLANDLEMRRPG